MPDHVHVLLMPGSEANPIRFIQSVKGQTTHRYWSLCGSGKLWQRGFYDHILRSDENVTKAAEYILGNPVRKGIVERMEEYPFSGLAIIEPL